MKDRKREREGGGAGKSKIHRKKRKRDALSKRGRDKGLREILKESEETKE